MLGRETRNASTAKQIASECHAVRLRAVNRTVSGIYDDALRPLGLKTSQLNVLVSVSVADSAQPAQVARRLQMDKSTLSRNVKKMKARGWIRSREAATGGQMMTLTTEGEELLEAAFPLWKTAQEQAQKLLGDKGVAAVRDLHRSTMSAIS